MKLLLYSCVYDCMLLSVLGWGYIKHANSYYTNFDNVNEWLNIEFCITTLLQHAKKCISAEEIPTYM